MQIPFNSEKTLEGFFPKGMETDLHGNYFIKIGDSKTMFCGHLDTYCYEYKRVYHIIDGNIIKTDGTTTLGGDDKAGITIMIKMKILNIISLLVMGHWYEGGFQACPYVYLNGSMTGVGLNPTRYIQFPSSSVPINSRISLI